MCFFKDHNCNLFMCNKCKNKFHSKYFKNHRLHKIDKDNQNIFTGYCQENNHLEALNFFCKNHNKLCCSSCICKIKNEIYGQHTDCDVCYINDIKEEKKAKLRENIKQLQDLSNNIYEFFNKIKKLYEIINKNKEDLKIKIQGIFTKKRNILNKIEDDILLEIDKKYVDKYFKEELIKEIEKLPNKIKLSLEKGIAIDKEWDNDNKLNIIINDCINIENNINLINNIIKKCNNIDNLDIKFCPDEESEINSFLEINKGKNEIEIINDIFTKYSKQNNGDLNDLKTKDFLSKKTKNFKVDDEDLNKNECNGNKISEEIKKINISNKSEKINIINEKNMIKDGLNISENLDINEFEPKDKEIEILIKELDNNKNAKYEKDDFFCDVCFVFSSDNPNIKYSVSKCNHVLCNKCWANNLHVKLECPKCQKKTRPNTLTRLYNTS